MKSKIAEDLGRLFEVGFNIGILTYIQQQQIKSNFGNLYLEDLQHLKFQKMLKQIINKIVSTQERQTVEKWTTFFLMKGFLAGLNFFGEYIQSNGWNNERNLRHLEIVYYQCCFSDENSIGTYPKGEEQWFREVLSQFEQVENISQYIKRYKEKGEFLNADTLMLLRCRREYRVICVDLSVFSLNSYEDISNLNYIEILRRLLIREIGYLRSKSVFSQLRIDTSCLDFQFSEDLKSYFTAFKYDDKESAKLIQAAGYAYSFSNFLRETGIIKDDTSVIFNVLGHSNRGISAICVRQENLDVLKTCHEIYKHDSSGKDIEVARSQVLNKIKRSAYTSFDKGKEFVEQLLAIPPDAITAVNHREKLDNFFNSVGTVPAELMQELGLSGNMSLRDAHARLIEKALLGKETYIFLTGNPGIGKTTAIANFLKSHLEEGFLFLYASPRKQVNLDIIEKFKDTNTGELCDKRILAINSHSDLITDNSGQYTVQYHWNQKQGDFSLQAVHFFDSRTTERRGWRTDILERKSEDRIQDAGRKSRGVLNSVCEAISAIIDGKVSNNIVATVSIQSLKKTVVGDTLKHLEKIFRNAYIEREAKVITPRMQEISGRIKHLFIMIDEITGDEGGVEFLSGISSILSKYKLTDAQNGFNTKVIVADASIVDSAVIKQHLEDTSAEPDKIYFRRGTDTPKPLAVQPFNFKGLAATVINANSYPAKSLAITYKVFVESYKFNPQARLERKNSLDKITKQEILQDLKRLLKKSDVDQIIVYIQNKPKLTELIEKIRKDWGEFKKGQDYLEIHANISEEDKQQIERYKNQVKIVFMTASGSRGLSFPKTKHILVEIPKFEIEKNLMEVIQVIYRGRGNDQIDNQDKELIFYLADRAVYYEGLSTDQVKTSILADNDLPKSTLTMGTGVSPKYEENYSLSLQESVLSILNLLLILKASIMTRISGVGQIGRDKFMIIPIGGKSVSAAGETFSGKMASLIRNLKKESEIKRSDRFLETVYQSLEQLLGQADFVVRNTLHSPGNSPSSYLVLRDYFNNQFSQLLNKGFDKLLTFSQIEPGYINGSLLVVPIADRTLEETYLMRMREIKTYANGELLKQMRWMTHSQSYPENLRSAIKDAIELVKELKESVKSQKFEQYSQRFDQYYAIPLFTLIAGEVMSQYYESEPKEPESERFRDILYTYVRCLYPVGGNFLPIGDKYKEFPFIVFKSYSLGEIRSKVFTDKYLLNSPELNVLNLLLSQKN